MISSKRITNLLIASYFAMFIVLGMIEASLGIMLPSLANKMGVPLSQASIIFSAHALGYLFASFLGGRFFDQKPGHRVLSSMMVFSVMFMFFIPLTPSFWMITGLFFFLGIAAGMLDIGGNTLLIWALGPAVGPFMNSLHLFYGVGTFLIPLIITGVTSISGAPEKAYWLVSLLLIPIIISLIFLPSPRMNTSQGNTITGQGRGFLVALLIILFFLITGAEFAFGGWIYSYAIASNLVNGPTAAYLTSAYWGSFTLARLASIPAATRLRSQTILQAGLTIALAGLGAISLFPHSLAGIWIGTICVGIGIATLFPTALSWAGQFLQIDGRTTGLFFVGASLGNMTLPWLIGQFFEKSGPQVTLLITAIALAVAFLILKGVIIYLKRMNPVGVENERNN
jgi:FHS family Na+ dependent glucose MFS transporter 1